ncbi:unnamed protein product [Parnassius apollo]|uniref:(apollo) hypothetical protein n=1 Tax=Parnassius apollo TaxID=110799 RepID=A0A8S3W1L0_PARAO|nr:unnamed protein product [Parnassius apollo]
MPKRSADEKIERNERKIRKLRERDVARHRRIRVISSEYSNNEGQSTTTPEPMLEPELTPEPELTLEPETRAEKPLEPLALEATLTKQNQNGESSEPELDSEFLEALATALLVRPTSVLNEPLQPRWEDNFDAEPPSIPELDATADSIEVFSSEQDSCPSAAVTQILLGGPITSKQHYIQCETPAIKLKTTQMLHELAGAQCAMKNALAEGGQLANAITI